MHFVLFSVSITPLIEIVVRDCVTVYSTEPAGVSDDRLAPPRRLCLSESCTVEIRVPLPLSIAFRLFSWTRGDAWTYVPNLGGA